MLIAAISNLGRSTTPTSKYSPPPQPTTTTGTDRRENVHVIFSTDCSMFQSWQSYTVFASAYRVNQPGNITRIVSGCSHEEKEEMERYHNTYINPSLSENYYVHFTPSYDLTSEGTFSLVTRKRRRQGNERSQISNTIS